MNRGLVISVCLILAVCAGFLASRLLSNLSEAPREEASMEAQLEWLRQEFDLNEDEFERVSELHAAYLPVCESFCQKILVARDHVREISLAGSMVTPELEAALQAESALRAECQAAMLRHLYETAGALPADKGKRYLEAMLPEVLSMTTEPSEHRSSH